MGNNMWPRQSGLVLGNRREQLLLTQRHGRLQMLRKVRGGRMSSVKSLCRQAGCGGLGLNGKWLQMKTRAFFGVVEMGPKRLCSSVIAQRLIEEHI